MTVRSRSLPHFGYAPILTDTLDASGHSIVGGPIVTPVVLTGFQTTISSSHDWPPNKKLAYYDLDRGGDFATQTATWDSLPSYADVSGPAGALTYTFKGPVFVQTHSSTLNSGSFLPVYSVGQMNAAGTIGISRALPTNPLSGMGQFIGELRDLPRVPFKNWKKQAKKFRHLARNGSSEYLNIQFGWVPFVNDLRDFAKVTSNLTKNASQYARNSGKDIRRKSTVSTSEDTSVAGPATWFSDGSIPTYCISSFGKYTLTTKNATRIWFSGAFTYYLPDPEDGFLQKMGYYEAQANHLYGVRLNPDLLWQLAPWSWAAGWVTSAGAIVRNWSAFASDGLVMRYGYVMREISRTETWSGENLKLVGGHIVSAIDRKITISKQRARATPYGFGLNPSSFTTKQWSIIAALGISRAPRSLNF